MLAAPLRCNMGGSTIVMVGYKVNCHVSSTSLRLINWAGVNRKGTDLLQDGGQIKKQKDIHHHVHFFILGPKKFFR
jgi:hypothetical protein